MNGFILGIHTARENTLVAISSLRFFESSCPVGVDEISPLVLLAVTLLRVIATTTAAATATPRT